MNERILAVGAHAGDMEVACGSVLAKQRKIGDSVTLLHLTLGEGGNPALSPLVYGKQKKREAELVAEAIGAQVLFGPYEDGQIPDDESVRLFVADAIRQVRPTRVITHWKNSIHRDHARTHRIATDAVLLASLEGVQTAHNRHRGVKAVYFTDNWEDAEGFTPYLFVDVSDELQAWRDWIVHYQFIKGGVSTFAYLDYYTALARVRGAIAGRTHAVAFDVDAFDKKIVTDSLR